MAIGGYSAVYDTGQTIKEARPTNDLMSVKQESTEAMQSVQHSLETLPIEIATVRDQVDQNPSIATESLLMSPEYVKADVRNDEYVVVEASTNEICSKQIMGQIIPVSEANQSQVETTESLQGMEYSNLQHSASIETLPSIDTTDEQVNRRPSLATQSVSEDVDYNTVNVGRVEVIETNGGILPGKKIRCNIVEITGTAVTTDDIPDTPHIVSEQQDIRSMTEVEHTVQSLASMATTSISVLKAEGPSHVLRDSQAVIYQEEEIGKGAVAKISGDELAQGLPQEMQHSANIQRIQPTSEIQDQVEEPPRVATTSLSSPQEYKTADLETNTELLEDDIKGQTITGRIIEVAEPDKAVDIEYQSEHAVEASDSEGEQVAERADGRPSVATESVSPVSNLTTISTDSSSLLIRQEELIGEPTAIATISGGETTLQMSRELQHSAHIQDSEHLVCEYEYTQSRSTPSPSQHAHIECVSDSSGYESAEHILGDIHHLPDAPRGHAKLGKIMAVPVQPLETISDVNVEPPAKALSAEEVGTPADEFERSLVQHHECIQSTISETPQDPSLADESATVTAEFERSIVSEKEIVGSTSTSVQPHEMASELRSLTPVYGEVLIEQQEKIQSSSCETTQKLESQNEYLMPETVCAETESVIDNVEQEPMHASVTLSNKEMHVAQLHSQNTVIEDIGAANSGAIGGENVVLDTKKDNQKVQTTQSKTVRFAGTEVEADVTTVNRHELIVHPERAEDGAYLISESSLKEALMETKEVLSKEDAEDFLHRMAMLHHQHPEGTTCSTEKKQDYTACLSAVCRIPSDEEDGDEIVKEEVTTQEVTIVFSWPKHPKDAPMYKGKDPYRDVHIRRVTRVKDIELDVEDLPAIESGSSSAEDGQVQIEHSTQSLDSLNTSSSECIAEPKRRSVASAKRLVQTSEEITRKECTSEPKVVLEGSEVDEVTSSSKEECMQDVEPGSKQESSSAGPGPKPSDANTSSLES